MLAVPIGMIAASTGGPVRFLRTLLGRWIVAELLIRPCNEPAAWGLICAARRSSKGRDAAQAWQQEQGIAAIRP